ncbi:hypothetical protein fHeYen901_35 [Yersinia phage fHe-Yen9-01]|uniref:Zinc finger DksA/TraR C4-type domain-containing protein n=1 Tax=Yersinia phage fHe-Yen9-01 TaxID=1965363 RepID=A0A1V0DXD4_9CAUD|nr:hypothetical protein KNT60_gp034 [Yersinia phage fHe-Yen9-01]ARB05808.1 hypothetical protein fHeYen901_35 [Yersinia phage fHe-Yen9-01]
MAVGFAKDGAEQLEVQAVVDAGIIHARAQIFKGVSEKNCLDCGDTIPEQRRIAVAGVKYCIGCQNSHDSIFTRGVRNCWHRSMR